MRFWDSSAVVPLLVVQEASARADSWIAEDDALTMWTLTPVEVTSGLRRLLREKALDETAARLAEARMTELVGLSQLVVDVEAVKSIAARLLRLHPLRASDALQLGAALQWAESRPEGRILHTFDARLAVAAEREGFAVPSTPA